jgi:hypothetical protein
MTTSILPLDEQIGCDHRANARLRRAPRFVQDIAALLQFKSLQLSRSHDGACDIEFPAHWAKNAHAVDCRPDSFRNGTADGAVHVLAPLVAKGQPTTVRCLLLHAVRHLHTGGGRIKRLLGYAAGVAAMPIRPFIPTGAFEPELVGAMSEAFEAACKELDEAGQPKMAREVIAGRIIAAAKLGERDAARLLAAALAPP